MLYECFGISKQAYYNRIKRDIEKSKQDLIILDLIRKQRLLLPKLGGRKLYFLMEDELKQLNIKIGRDAFFDFLGVHHLLVKKTKRFHITTDSKHCFYKSPNRIKNLTPTHSEQVWVNDITYVKIQDKYAYLALVTDMYSKKIMGWKIDNNMKVSLVKDALNMALKNKTYNHENIIHHSDRGLQYCCPDYSQYAENKGMLLSTTKNHDPYENSVAERINGILKYEFGLIKTLPSIDVAEKMISEAVNTYNNHRPHLSLNFKTPNYAHINQNHKHKFYKQTLTNRAPT